PSTLLHHSHTSDPHALLTFTPHLALLSFFFECYGHHPHLHSFPTRRSSDLRRVAAEERHRKAVGKREAGRPHFGWHDFRQEHDRSEEHTSELQSLTNLVCRLLLEKKKKVANTAMLEDMKPTNRCPEVVCSVR